MDNHCPGCRCTGPTETSYEYRKNEVLKAVTENKPLPEYAAYGNRLGSIYIKYRDNYGWIFKDIDFYEIIEAVARRVVLKGSQRGEAI